MLLVWYRRYRRSVGEQRFVDWEFSSGLCCWDQAPAPAQIGKRLVEGVFHRKVPLERAALVNNVVHWTASAGARSTGSSRDRSPPRASATDSSSSIVWLTGYAVLTLAKRYKPIWKYEATTLAKDLSAHWVYGIGTAATFRLLTRPPDTRLPGCL